MKNKEKFINILKTSGLFLLLLFLPSILLVLIFNKDALNVSDKNYIIIYTISSIIISLIIIFTNRRKITKDFKDYFKNFDKNFEISFKYWLIGIIIMFISNLFITLVLKKQIAGNETSIRNYIKIMPILMYINTIICAPINEEMIFRKCFKDILPTKWIFVTLSGLIFGFLHISSYMTGLSDLIYLIPYSSVGIAFALLYYKTDNIFSSITMHAIHNLISIILIGVI